MQSLHHRPSPQEEYVASLKRDFPWRRFLTGFALMALLFGSLRALDRHPIATTTGKVWLVVGFAALVGEVWLWRLGTRRDDEVQQRINQEAALTAVHVSLVVFVALRGPGFVPRGALAAAPARAGAGT